MLGIAFLVQTLPLMQLQAAALEVPCMKIPKIQDFVLPKAVAGLNAKSYKRSEIECILSCKEKFPFQCSSVWYDLGGNCHEFFHEQDIVQDSPASWERAGSFYQLISLTTKNSCGGLVCSADEVCMKACDGNVLSSPICLADHSANCNLTQEFSNVRHYFTPGPDMDETDQGLLQFLTYPKKRSDSGLRVQYNSDVCAHWFAAGCHRWFFKFNGFECTNPSTIEMIDYQPVTGNAFDRNMDMDGICFGLGAGGVLIEVWIAACGGFGVTDGGTGWHSSRQLTVMEIIPAKTVPTPSARNCPSSSHFNLLFETWSQNGDETVDLRSTIITVKGITYRKLANDSALRIKYQAPLGVLVDNTAVAHCAKWFVTINGSNCNPEGNFVVHPASSTGYSLFTHHVRTRTLECICENSIPAGPALIEIKIGTCMYEHSYPVHVRYGLPGSPSKIFVEELRLGKLTGAIHASDRKIYISDQTNTARHLWNPLNSGQSLGDVVSLTYTKRFSNTALKLTASGDHRTYKSASPCNRWFFKINGAECSSPGSIQSVHKDENYMNYHQPMQTSGLCYGLAAGTYTITYATGYCSGWSAVADAYSGWGSSFFIFVEELRLQATKICSGVPKNCN